MMQSFCSAGPSLLLCGAACPHPPTPECHSVTHLYEPALRSHEKTQVFHIMFFFFLNTNTNKRAVQIIYHLPLMLCPFSGKTCRVLNKTSEVEVSILIKCLYNATMDL